MRYRILGAALAVLLVPWIAAADDAPAGTPPSATISDVQDVVFLRGSRPVLLRLHVRINGLPFEAVWHAYMDALFKYLDRDGDGVLNKEEAGRTLKAQVLVQQVQSNGFFFLNPQSFASLAEIDPKATDDKITREQLANYYRQSGFHPLQLNMLQGQGAMADALTDALFKQLDLDKDGKLSKDELLQAEKTLRKLDTDDDETISIQEVVANPFNFNRFVPQGQPAVPGSPLFVLVKPGEYSQTLVEQMLRAYDKDRNNRLSREEINLDKTVFDQLDANHDGELDESELSKFPNLNPDLECIVRIGNTGDKELAADLVIPEGRTLALASSVSRAGNYGLKIAFGAAQIDLRRVDSMPPVGRAQNIRQFYLQQFKAADKDNRGFVEKKDLMQNRQFQILAGPFDLADRDNDGKLTEAELNAFLDLQDKTTLSFVSLAISDQGRGLFEALDVNRDGRLSIRELRSAWDRLAGFDKENAGYITRASIPSQFQVAVSRGPANLGNQFGRPVVVNSPFGGAVPGVPTPTKGPLWFRKMDRNGDGDVSLREWLGSLEDFRRIDINGDGLIDLEEAEKADIWFRNKAASDRN